MLVFATTLTTISGSQCIVQTDWIPRTNRSWDFCEGTLISRRHVLTAAHCFSQDENDYNCSVPVNAPPIDVLDFARAYVGGRCRHFDQDYCGEDELGEKIRIARVYFDEFFTNKCHGEQDLALIELEKDVPAKYHHICIPFLHKEQKALEDPNLRMASYGYSDADNGDVVAYIQKIDLSKKISEEQCKRLSKYKPKGTFCTYGVNDLNYCRTDSAGGVTTAVNGKTFLMGVVSFGAWCKDMKNKKGPKVQPRKTVFHEADNQKCACRQRVNIVTGQAWMCDWIVTENVVPTRTLYSRFTPTSCTIQNSLTSSCVMTGIEFYVVIECTFTCIAYILISVAAFVKALVCL